MTGCERFVLLFLQLFGGVFVVRCAILRRTGLYRWKAMYDGVG